MDPHLGHSLVTDAKRLQQVLRNLLSNAIKFTEKGGVQLRVFPATGGWGADHPVLSGAASVVAFEVSDTGIGIPLDKQHIIFEALQQADAGTSRKYGGTGLGLAISRELSNLLGGEIQLRSTPGLGSTFTLYLLQTYAGPAASSLAVLESATAPTLPRSIFPAVRVLERPNEEVSDDRDNLRPGDAVLLIVEDDPHYVRILRDLPHDKGFKVIVARRGADALNLARQYHPTAVSLDVFLPDMLGWTVLSHLKQDPTTRHIPVQMITLDEDRQHGLARGAFAFVTKPTTPEALEAALSRMREFALSRRKRPLVVEDDAAEQLSITALLAHDDIDIAIVEMGEEALAALRQQSFERGARRTPAGYLGVRGAGAHARRCLTGRRAGGGVHRQGIIAGRGCPVAYAGRQGSGQGRRIARAVAGRDHVVPAPGGRRPAAGEAAAARSAAAPRRCVGRQEGVGRGRRRAQHLRPEQRAGASWADRADRRHRP